MPDLASSVVLLDDDIEKGQMYTTIRLMMAALKREAEELGVTLVANGEGGWERYEDGGRVTIRFETKLGDG